MTDKSGCVPNYQKKQTSSRQIGPIHSKCNWKWLLEDLKLLFRFRIQEKQTSFRPITSTVSEFNQKWQLVGRKLWVHSKVPKKKTSFRQILSRFSVVSSSSFITLPPCPSHFAEWSIWLYFLKGEIEKKEGSSIEGRDFTPLKSYVRRTYHAYFSNLNESDS